MENIFLPQDDPEVEAVQNSVNYAATSYETGAQAGRPGNVDANASGRELLSPLMGTGKF